ncbi:hypothetical protein CPB83DRAFT_864746 [Crepidotus variabilis]|uniref:Uncharacterized protein n=1 Tax=Crepidotus variabilis TaxID=179855 RepID=A0A9P6E470_9AGAR|nr:hypothetical protein CPB83DRAFT_864746 [Crepidotus variabilis]
MTSLQTSHLIFIFLFPPPSPNHTHPHHTMMDAPPLPASSTTTPSMRQYLFLIRLQILTPLSLLLNIASLLLCSFIAEPNISAIARTHPTSITPQTSVLAGYVGAVWVAQIGYCVLLVGARKEETKRAMTQGVGLSLMGANVVMAGWGVAWILQQFLLATILLGLLILFLLFSNLSLLIYHPPTRSRPLDTALIHAPLRFFLILPMSILFPLCLFLTLHLTYHPTPSGPPQNYADWHATPGFLVVFFTNLFSLVVIVVRRDVVWCVAAMWVCMGVWSSAPKPAGVYITEITYTVLHPLGLVVSMVYMWMRGRQEVRRGPVVLEGDEHPGLHGNGHGHGERPAAVAAGV